VQQQLVQQLELKKVLMTELNLEVHPHDVGELA
jgi:hypothetical protein